jgi:nitrite reductase/ring-hydroxylating ferredoxin subunit
MPAKQTDPLAINPNQLDLVHVATYERRVQANLERVWENVRDWEHLPHLHHTSFDYCELDEAGDWGWRVWSDPAHSSWFELVIDSSRYVVRTFVAGAQVSEIWTYLEAHGDSTAVTVKFHATGVTPENKEEMGQLYLAVYDTLWNEDEGMMCERQRRLDQQRDRAAAKTLGWVAELKTALPLRFELLGREYLLTREGDNWVATPTICPHMLGPLEPGPQREQLRCPWHGYVFDLASGRCVSPPGARCRLGPRPTLEESGGQLLARSASPG